MKMKFKRFLSRVMAVATLASVIVLPVAVSASEIEPEPPSFEQQYPELKDVQDSLYSDEIVTANDIELSYGEEFEVEVDLSGIEWIDESKMKILFHEAKNEDGADFDTHTPDTYKDVYAVEPVSRHSSYIISRNITVKEPETEQQSENSSEIVVDDNGDTGDSKDVRQICEEILICIFCSFYFYDMKLHEIKMSLISVKKLIKMRYVFTRINISVHIRLIFH